MKKLKEILLVDDSKGTNALNKRLLEQMEVADKITVAVNGKLALDYLTDLHEKGEHQKPDLIFLDINMPVMDGYQFLEAYSKLFDKKDIRNIIVLLSTSIREVDKEKSKKYESVVSYQFKPLTREKVRQTIDQIS